MSHPERATRIARLGAALRGHAVAVTIGDEIAAARAWSLVDADDRAELHFALRCALRIPRDAQQTFERLFACFWQQRDYPTRRSRAPGGAASRSRSEARLPGWDPEAGRLVDEAADGEPKPGDDLGYSPAELLRRKPLPRCTPSELAAIGRVVERLARRLATRRSRRLVPSRRGFADPHRSFRRAIRNGGEFVTLARRARAIERPRIVFVCDSSGSMQGVSRFVLGFALALRRVAPRTEAFCFSTRLTHLTPYLHPDRLGPTLDRLAEELEDWGGGTRIGASLSELAARHGRRVLGPRSVVVILSDGLDRGEPELLSAAMAAIRGRVRRLVWLNPLAGEARYQPLAAGMRAALPFVDHFAAARDLESLERLVPELML